MVSGQLSESRIFADSADGADFGDFCLLSVFVRMARLETLTVWGRKLESLRYKHQRSVVGGQWTGSVYYGLGTQTGKFAVQTSAIRSRVELAPTGEVDGERAGVRTTLYPFLRFCVNKK